MLSPRARYIPVPPPGVLYKDDGFFAKVDKWIPYTDGQGLSVVEVEYSGLHPDMGKYRLKTPSDSYELDGTVGVNALPGGRVRATFRLLRQFG